MTVAVIGAAGHIGANVVQALLERGTPTRAVVNRNTGPIEHLDVERLHADVADLTSVSAAIDGADVVYNVAGVITMGRNPMMEKVNTLGAANVAKACQKSGTKLIHFSSIHALSIYPLDEPTTETRSLALDAPEGSYDRSKVDGDLAVMAQVEQGLDAVILHPTGVIGPADFNPSQMGAAMLAMAQRKLLGVVNAGFNWVDVRDVATAAVAASTRGQRGHRYLLPGHWCLLSDLASMVSEVTGRRVNNAAFPLWLAKAAAPFSEAWADLRSKDPLFTRESLRMLHGHRKIIGQKALDELGHSPRPIRETLHDLFGWFTKHGMLTDG